MATVFPGKWEFLGDQRSTPLRPLWFAIASGLWFAALWIVASYLVESDEALISGATAFVVYTLLTATQASTRTPQWPADLSYEARRRAAWAVRRGEAAEDPATAAGVVAAAASVQRQQAPSVLARAIFGVLVVIAIGGIAVVAIATGSALQIAGAVLLLAIALSAIVRNPGALRRQRDNAAAALAGARRVLGEPAA